MKLVPIFFNKRIYVLKFRKIDNGPQSHHHFGHCRERTFFKNLNIGVSHFFMAIHKTLLE